MARHCDYCGESERVNPVHDTIATLSRTIPGTGGRAGKAKTDKFGSHKLGELCDPCGQRYDLAIGNLLNSIRVRETPLPDPIEPEMGDGSQGQDAGEVETEPAEELAERQEQLSLNGESSEVDPPKLDDSQAEAVSQLPAVETEPGHGRKRGRDRQHAG